MQTETRPPGKEVLDPVCRVRELSRTFAHVDPVKSRFRLSQPVTT
ncbi:hypothetical protein ACLK19_05000 [Escherichia coli]